MMNIIKRKNSHGYDTFTIKTSQGNFCIHYEANFDLYWTFKYDSTIIKTPDFYEITIDKDNYFFFCQIEKLYYSIKNNQPYYNYPYPIDNREEEKAVFMNDDPQRLFKNNVVDWHSDDDEYSCTSRLIIKKCNEDEFKIVFVKSKDTYFFETFSVRISNSGSRYEPYNIPFMSMYKALKDYDYENHQIHYEEYLCRKRKIKARGV